MTMNRRMDRSKLNIGAYFLQPYARTERHVREVKECGIDFIIGLSDDKATLDLFEKYGLGAVVGGVLPGWWGGDGDNAGQMAATNPLSAYEKAAEAFVDHPAVWGIDTGDEPSALDFPHYGKVTALTERLFKNQFAYLNLYPNYASVAQNSAAQTVNQLGTATYDEHIDSYCRNVGLDYLCYDFYMYSLSADHASHKGIHRAYENLRVVADACRATGRDMWIVLQVNSNRPEEWISLDQLRFQAFSAMAFGAQVITWGCYTAGWWHNQVLDERGEKTAQYDKLRAVNAEIHALGERYMMYRNTSTHFIGFTGGHALSDTRAAAIPALDTGAFRDLRAAGGAPLIAGQMVARDGSGRQALFLCDASDPWGEKPVTDTVRFTTDGRGARVTSAQGEIKPAVEGGQYTFAMPSCGGVLIEAE